jgi:hypothetical protein
MAHTATGAHHPALAAACSAQQRAHRESLGCGHGRRAAGACRVLGCGHGRRTARRSATGSGSASSGRSSTWSSHCPTRSSCRCVRTHARTHANAGCMLHAASDVARRPSHLQQRHSLYYADWFAPSLIHGRQCRIGILTPVRRQPVQSSAVLRAAAGCRRPCALGVPRWSTI